MRLLTSGRAISNAATLSFEAIVHAPGAPGRVFLFDENDVADRLAALDDVTDGALRWSETAGLKQVVRNIDIDAAVCPILDSKRLRRALPGRGLPDGFE